MSRLSTRLEASGITVTKYAVATLSVKCIDRATGEEIYYNTALPKGTGSWATEEEALAQHFKPCERCLAASEVH